MIPVQRDNKVMMTPVGHPLEVPTQELAEAIRNEWENLESHRSTKGYQGKVLTSLAATAIDRMPTAAKELVQMLVSICENDQLLCWTDQTETVLDAQEKQWGPLIAYINQVLGLSLVPRFDFSIRDIELEDREKLSDWCQELSPFQLAAFAYMAELTHSFIVPHCLIQGKLENASQAWSIAELHENSQRDQWGEDEDDVARSRALQEEFELTHRFYQLASGGT